MHEIQSDMGRMNLEKIKSGMLKGMDALKIIIGRSHVEPFVRNIDFEGNFFLLKLAKKNIKNLMSLIEYLDLDQVLEELGVKGVLISVEMMLDESQKFLDASGLQSSLQEIKNIVVKSLDFRSLQMFWEDLLKGIDLTLCPMGSISTYLPWGEGVNCAT